MVFHIAYFLFAALLVLASVFPFVSHQYWVFRVCEFARIQVLALLSLTFLGGFLLSPASGSYIWWVQAALLFFIAQHIFILAPYFPLKKELKSPAKPENTPSISMISANVLQFNTEYHKLIDLINEVQPDIFLTIETNSDWEQALSVLDESYPYHQKIALENTYGMHFYSKLEVTDLNVNYYMSDDLPSIQADIITPDQQTFTFFGIHPPPPSPTEESTSKERDGELIVIGKKAKNATKPLIVVGDFNNVAWSKSTVLFRKLSGLQDARIGRGLYSTYHAKYKLMQFPIDLLYHSHNIVIEEFKVLGDIGSDHFPLYTRFYIAPEELVDEKPSEYLEKEELEEAEEMIVEGKKEEGNRD